MGKKASVTCEEVEAALLLDRNTGDDREEQSERVVGEENGGANGNENGNRDRRERCRRAARRLAARGEVFVTQNGKIVDPSTAKGVMIIQLPS